MKQSTQMIEIFNRIANCAHPNVMIDNLLSEQPSTIKNIILEQDANKLRSYFDKSDYFADSIKIFEL